MIKIMSFNVCSKDYWKGEEKQPISENWMNDFSKIVNDSDIIFLQEVKTKQEEVLFLKDFLNKQPNQKWCFYDTGSFSTRDGQNFWDDRYNNAVLYKEEMHCEDFTDKYYMNSQTKKEKVQVIKFIHDNKTIIGLNVHLSSDSNTDTSRNNKHANEFRRIWDFLLKLQKENPDAGVFAMGDYNFAVRYLKNIMKEKNIGEWIIDDEAIFNEKEIEFYTTVLSEGQSGHAMDHFIYNPKTLKINKQFFTNGQTQGWYDINLGVQHRILNTDPDITIDGGKSYIKASDYRFNVSDHYPITIQIQ